MSLNVYFNAAALLSPRTGIGQYCLNLMSELENFREVEPHYFYGRDWSDQLLRQAPTTVTPTQKAKRVVAQVIPDLAYGIQQRWRERRFRAGITFITSAVYHEPNFLSFRTPLPTVVTIHDLSILRYPETHPKDRVAFMTRRIGESIRRADCVISDSEYGRQEILAEFKLPPEKVVSVLLAAGSGFSPVAADRLPAVLKPFGLQPQQYILSVGTLEPRKNLTTAIKAYARLPEVIRAEIPLVIAGMKGWRTDGLEREVAALIEKGQIRRLGYVPDEALPALYSGARAFVYPSLYEGFGLPPLEAMACGAPVIVSNRSSLPEVVGDVGLQVDALDVDGLAQAMSQIIEDDVLRASLRQRGMERAKGFSWRRCAEETLAVYRKVVTG
ncbi:MAG: glycosyl transferase, group 1 [Proteobacteria bacterium]|nr:glycosyl transferase, group 1 [Pseudomonadota bacterium]